MTPERLAAVLIEDYALAAPAKPQRDPNRSVADLLLGRTSQHTAKAAAADDEAPPVDKKIAVFFNRALLRIFGCTSLMTYLNDASVFPVANSSDGSCKIQFVFNRLPDEVHPQVVRLIAAPRDPKFTKFVDRGQALTGLEMEVKPEDFGGEDYDYANS